jgi:hypothetical protein
MQWGNHFLGGFWLEQVEQFQLEQQAPAAAAAAAAAFC